MLVLAEQRAEGVDWRQAAATRGSPAFRATQREHGLPFPPLPSQHEHFLFLTKAHLLAVMQANRQHRREGCPSSPCAPCATTVTRTPGAGGREQLPQRRRAGSHLPARVPPTAGKGGTANTSSARDEQLHLGVPIQPAPGKLQGWWETSALTARRKFPVPGGDESAALPTPLSAPRALRNSSLT